MKQTPHWDCNTIRALRKRRGWTPQDMAKKMSLYAGEVIPVSRLNSWERGVRNVGADSKLILDRLHRESL